MTRVARLGALAEQDLVDIWQFTAERWNEEQADSYLDAIGHVVRELTVNPEMGVKRDGVRPGYRVMFVNQHAIYYLVMPAAVKRLGFTSD